MVVGLPSEVVEGVVVGEVDGAAAVMLQQPLRQMSKRGAGKRRIRGQGRIIAAAIREPRRWLAVGSPDKLDVHSMGTLSLVGSGCRASHDLRSLWKR